MWAAINELDRAEVLREAGLVTEAERSLAERLARRSAVTTRRAIARRPITTSLDRSSATIPSALRSSRLLPRGASAASAVPAGRSEPRRSCCGRGSLSGAIDRAGTSRPRPASPSLRQRSVAKVRGRAPRAHGFEPEAEALRLTEALARIRRNPAAVMPAGADRQPDAAWKPALLAHELRAAHAAARNREAEVRRHAARGLDLLDRTQQAVGSLDLQVSAAMRGSGLITTGLSSAVRSGGHDVIFDWSERARLLSQQILPVRPPPDPTLAADLAELRVLRAAEPDGDWLATRAPPCCGIGRASANGRARAPASSARANLARRRAGAASGARRRAPLRTSSTGCGWPCSSSSPDAGRVRRAGLEGRPIGPQRPACRPRRVGDGDDRTDGSRRASSARGSTDRAVVRTCRPDRRFAERARAVSS